MNKRNFFKLGSIAQLAKLVHRSQSTIYRWKREKIPKQSKIIIEKILAKKQIKTKQKKVPQKEYKKIKEKIVESIHVTKREKEQEKEIRRLKRIIELKNQKLPKSTKPKTLLKTIIIPLTKREKQQQAEQLRLAYQEQARLGNIREVEKEKQKRKEKEEKDKKERAHKIYEELRKKELIEKFGSTAMYRSITPARTNAIINRATEIKLIKKPTSKQKIQLKILTRWIEQAILGFDYYDPFDVENYTDFFEMDDIHSTYDEIFGY